MQLLVGMQIFLRFISLILSELMNMNSPYSGFHFFVVKRREMFSSLFRIDLRERTVELMGFIF